MGIKRERKIEVNKWMIKARWYYVLGIFSFVFLSVLISKTDVDLVNFTVFSFCILLTNLLFYLIVKRFDKDISIHRLAIFGYAQVLVELVIITISIYMTGGEDSIFLIFYLIPILSSAFLLTMRDSFVIAVFSMACFIGVVKLEKSGLIPRIEYHSTGLAVKTSAALFLFLFFGAFSSFLKKVLLYRERLLQEKTEALSRESEYRQNEWEQLDRTTKLLVKRDYELTDINKELELKMKDLKRSEKSMLKAFSELKTERRRTETQKRKTLAIVSNLVDPIIVLDKNKKIDLFNYSAKNLLGLNDDDLVKSVSEENNFSMENFRDIIDVDYVVKPIEDPDSKYFAEEVTVTINEQELTYKVITAPVLDDSGDSIGSMKIFYDLTREKVLDRLKSEFISIAAHQLRTPLAAIKWVIKMVMDGDVGKISKEQFDFLEKGYKSNERIIELVNDMLNVSRIEEGRFGYSFSSGDIIKELDTVVDTLDSRIKEKNIKLEIIKPKKVPLVYMDPKKIILVLQNLIENAVKYTPEMGKIQIKIESKDKFIRFYIKDNGVGIPKADHEKLFSKFFRAANVVRMQTEGSGLGLFMVKNIISKHNGQIIFSSEEGIGSEFVFTLPIAKED